MTGMPLKAHASANKGNLGGELSPSSQPAFLTASPPRQEDAQGNLMLHNGRADHAHALALGWKPYNFKGIITCEGHVVLSRGSQ